MNIICAYQYSGSFWIRYIVEYISKKPTIGIYPDSSAIGSRISMEVDLASDAVLYERITPLITEKIQKSVFIIRNYMDVFAHKAADSDKIQTKNYLREVFNDNYSDYIDILRNYKSSKSNKILIYYEDLVKNPKVWITKILDFLLCDYKAKDLEDFFDNYDKHLKKCFEEFKKTHNYSESAVITFKTGINKQIRADMENMLIYYEPILFSDYLSRYIA